MNIASIVIYVICAAILGVSIFCGIKKGFFPGAIFLAFNAGAAVLSVLLSFVILSVSGNFFTEKLISILSDKLSDAEGYALWQSEELINYLMPFTKAALSIIIVPILYIIILALLQIPVHIINKKHSNTQKKMPVPACVLRIISAFLIVVMVFGPASAAVSAIMKSKENTLNQEGSVITDTISPLGDNQVLKAAGKAGGTAILNLVSASYRDGEKIYVGQEITNILTIAYTVPKLYPISDNSYSKEPLLYRYAKDAYNNSETISPVMLKVLNEASSKWLNGEDFLGYTFNIPDSIIGGFYKKFLTLICESDKNNISENYNTLIDLLELSSKYDFINSSSVKNILSAFSDEEFATELFVMLYKNENLRSLVPEISFAALSAVFNEMNVSLPLKDASQLSFENMTEEDAYNEAVLLSSLSKVIMSIEEKNGSMDIKDMSHDQVKELCNAITAFKDSYFLKTYVTSIIDSILETLVNALSSDKIINMIKDTFSEYITVTK